MLIWDTESWVANSDDRFAGVVAANRAAGYDRSMGTLSRIAVSTLSHRRVARDRIRSDTGPKTITRLVESRPLAAAYAAVQHFIGERAFKEIVFQNGLPWVFAFHGLENNPDDGTVVVVGDLATLFEKGTPLFNGVRSLDEVRRKQALRTALNRLPAHDPQRDKLSKQLAQSQPLTGASLTLEARNQPFGLYDSYGNAVPAANGKIDIPLDARGFFLRADPKKPGSFAALIEAIRQGQVRGLEPVEVIAHDMIVPIEKGPTLRLRLTSMHNQPISGRLSLTLADLQIEYPKTLTLAPRQQKWIDVKVRGRARADNTYPLLVEFDAGPAGRAVHEEDMHVNWISRKTIRVDGRLEDWKGVLPQVIRTGEAASQSFEEAMYLPFEKPRGQRVGGLAVGYLAYDDDNFYFAARIADDTPFPGTVRFAVRDPDADFYPKISSSRPERGGPLVQHVWPEGVRRFSYRRWPDIPSGMPQNPFDNVLLGFNVIPPEQKDWLTHLPGRMPKFIWSKTTDYEYALNKVADRYGGGTEIWRLLAPGLPYKHFFPRQPSHPLEGAVTKGRLEIRYEEGWRIVECALPWSEIPDVKKLVAAGRPIKFDFRVNDNTPGPDMELARNRSVAEGISHSFHPNWIRSWPNELEFGVEK